MEKPSSSPPTFPTPVPTRESGGGQEGGVDTAKTEATEGCGVGDTCDAREESRREGSCCVTGRGLATLECTPFIFVTPVTFFEEYGVTLFLMAGGGGRGGEEEEEEEEDVEVPTGGPDVARLSIAENTLDIAG